MSLRALEVLIRLIGAGARYFLAAAIVLELIVLGGILCANFIFAR